MDPVRHYRPGITERIFTNPCAPDYGAYPCPCPVDLQRRFAALVEAECGHPLGLGGDNVLFTPGSTVGFDLLIRAYCEPRVDAICVTRPTFPVYAHYARAGGVSVKEIAAAGEEYDELDVERLVSSPSKLTIICRPSWPLGALPTLDSIRDICRRTSGLVVVDEAYIDFSDADSAVTLMPDVDNLIVSRTFSKAWGLAGLRVGALIGAECLLYPVRLLLDPFSFGSAAQSAVAARFDQVEWVRTVVRTIRAERERLSDELGRAPSIVRVFRSHANFVCATIDDAPRFLKSAAAGGLLVSDINQFVANGVRMSVSHREHSDRLMATVVGHSTHGRAVASRVS